MRGKRECCYRWQKSDSQESKISCFAEMQFGRNFDVALKIPISVSKFTLIDNDMRKENLDRLEKKN